MPHLAGRCSCGRPMHWPKSAKLGSTWNCWKCGKTWTLSNHGEPLHTRKSKAPPKEDNISYHYNNSNSGCLVVLIATMGALIYLI